MWSPVQACLWLGHLSLRKQHLDMLFTACNKICWDIGDANGNYFGGFAGLQNLILAIFIILSLIL